jgi:hypothetical protein
VYPFKTPMLDAITMPTYEARFATSCKVAPTRFPTRVETATLTAKGTW